MQNDLKIKESSTLMVAENWVSNKNWMVNLGRVKDGRILFASVDTAKAAFPKCNRVEGLTEEKVQAILKYGDELKPFHYSHWHVDFGYRGKATAYVAEDGECAFFDEDYLTMLGKPETLYSKDNNSIAFDEKEIDQITIAIMPVRIEHDIFVLKFRG